MKNVKIFITLLIVFAAFCMNAAPHGPYKAQGLAFYFVHDGGALKIGAKLNSNKNGAVVLKILDAEEKEVFFDYVKFTGAKNLSHDFGKNAPAGIYQMRVSGANYTIDPESFPVKKYGVYATRSTYYFTDKNQFKDACFLIPEGAKKLNWNLIGISGKITDAKGNEIIKNKRRGNMDVSKHVGEIWKFSCLSPKADNYHSFGLGGIPAILCPDEATARAIGGSVEKASDGTLYAHKYQVRIHNWLKSLKPADWHVDLVDLRTLKDKFAAEKELRGILGAWGVFSYINYQLKNQNLNPADKKFGSVYNVAALGLVNSLEAPFNPYAGKLDTRILMAALPAFLKEKESDTGSESSSSYCGGDALVYIGRITAFLEGAKSIKDKQMRDLWYDAAKRALDRFSMFRVSCENQSSHYPYCYQALYAVYGNEKYKELAADYIHQLNDPVLNPFMQTGYQQEAYGPDATYQGLGQSLQALYYRMSGNKEALEGCRTVHDFMSHSVVREPDGRVVGSSNFSHRTAGSWNKAQYAAGWALLKHEIESAAVLSGTSKKMDQNKLLEYLAPIKHAHKNAIGYATVSFSPYNNAIRYKVDGIKNPKLPHEKNKNYIKNFNNEFLAVRKNGYYMFQYLKGTAPARVKNLRFKTVKNPKLPVYKWTQLQGTSILWFEGYGALITGMNWNGDTFHILRGDLPDGKLAYPDYWKHNAKVLDGGNKIVEQGNLFQADGVTYTRQTECLENGVRITATAKFAKDIQFKNFAEQLPLLVDKPGFSLEFLVDGKWTGQPGMATAVRCSKKIVIKFDKAYQCQTGPSCKNSGQTVAPLQITLGKDFKAGDEVRIVYTIQPEK